MESNQGDQKSAKRGAVGRGDWVVIRGSKGHHDGERENTVGPLVCVFQTHGRLSVAFSTNNSWSCQNMLADKVGSGQVVCVLS